MPRLFFGLLAALSIAAAPGVAFADHLDVLQTKLNDGCTMDKYLAIVRDFNSYYESRGYQTEILVPIASQNQDAFFWSGRSANSEAFGKAFDHWEAELAKSGSKVSKLSARFNECSTTISRSTWSTRK